MTTKEETIKDIYEDENISNRDKLRVLRLALDMKLNDIMLDIGGEYDKGIINDYIENLNK